MADEFHQNILFCEGLVLSKILQIKELRTMIDSKEKEKVMYQESNRLRQYLRKYAVALKSVYSRKATRTSFPKGYNPHDKKKEPHNFLIDKDNGQDNIKPLPQEKVVTTTNDLDEVEDEEEVEKDGIDDDGIKYAKPKQETPLQRMIRLKKEREINENGR